MLHAALVAWLLGHVLCVAQSVAADTWTHYWGDARDTWGPADRLPTDSSIPI